MKKFEYVSIDLGSYFADGSGDSSEAISLDQEMEIRINQIPNLNKLGLEGWEMVSCVTLEDGNITCFLKREIR